MAKIAGEGEGEKRKTEERKRERESGREGGREGVGGSMQGGCGAAAIGLRQEPECE